jgi:addiction module RelB/DinJ family antitoxin
MIEKRNGRSDSQMATINYTLRIDEVDKQKAEQVFKALGMTFSTGINVYIKTVGRQQGIPFALTIGDITPTATLSDAFKALQEESAKNGTTGMTLEEIDAEIAAYRREKRSE